MSDSKRNSYKPIKEYYLATPSKWPIVGSLGLFCLALGVVNLLHDNILGHYLFFAGALLIAYMMFGWFSSVIDESLQGLHSKQMDRTYRFGMAWFIVSEVSFFGIFFFALFYTRFFAVPELGGLIRSPETHAILWPQFKAIWPLLKNPNPTLYPGPTGIIPAFGIPILNTILLLSSAATITWAHWGLKKNKIWQRNLGLLLTIILGLVFIGLQAHEYFVAHTELDLTLSSGIYGTTFFMLTGFHAAHVSIGLIMLIIILIRSLKGHFHPEHHFAFEAVSWYWHFVDVVWLFLFVFVYWL